MKGLKFYALGLAAALMLNSCGMSNTAKGGIIGGSSGAALGAALGALIAKSGNKGKWAGIAGGIGAAAGTAVGLVIGKKMDNAKKAAEAIANAKVEDATDANGYQAVKVTFESGILFPSSSATLGAAAQSSLTQFATNVLNVYTDCDVAIYGFASSDGSDATNLTLSQSRANAVRGFLTNSCGVNANQIKGTTGYGEDPNYLVYDANGKEDRNASRRVEVYLYASEAMINAANAGTLQ